MQFNIVPQIFRCCHCVHGRSLQDNPGGYPLSPLRGIDVFTQPTGPVRLDDIIADLRKTKILTSTHVKVHRVWNLNTHRELYREVAAHFVNADVDDAPFFGCGFGGGL